MGTMLEMGSPIYIVIHQILWPLILFVMFYFQLSYHHLRPLSERSQPLLLVTSLGGGILLYILTFDVPCGLVAMSRNFFVPVGFLPFYLRIHRLYLKKTFEEAIQIENANDRLKALIALSYQKSNRRLMMLLLLALIPQISVTAYGYLRNTEKVLVNNVECSETSVEAASMKISTFLYIVVGIYGTNKVKGIDDTWGIHAELTALIKLCTANGIVYFILLSLDPDTGPEGPSYVFIQVHHVMFTFGSILRPALQSRAAFKKISSEVASGDVDLIYILNDKVGYATFLDQAKAEFSSENLSFWTQVNVFRSPQEEAQQQEEQQTGEQQLELELEHRAVQIYEEFISPQAPLQVNLPSKMQLSLTKQITEKKKFSRNMYDEAQEEVYKLMEKDTFPRYKQGPHFGQFQHAVETRGAHTNLLSLATSSVVSAPKKKRRGGLGENISHSSSTTSASNGPSSRILNKNNEQRSWDLKGSKIRPGGSTSSNNSSGFSKVSVGDGGTSSEK